MRIFNQIAWLCRTQNMEKSQGNHEISTFRRILPQVNLYFVKRILCRFELITKLLSIHFFIYFTDFGGNSKKLHHFQFGWICSISIHRHSIATWNERWLESEWNCSHYSRSNIMVGWVFKLILSENISSEREKHFELISATCAYITQPIGAVISGPICDKFGRRKMILVSTVPLTLAWILLGFSQSFPLICTGFAVIGFCMGLKESPTLTFVSEISEPSIRGALSTAGLFTHQTGFLIVFGLGLVFSWRQIALICALFPIFCFVSVLFVSWSTWIRFDFFCAHFWFSRSPSHRHGCCHKIG